MWTLRAMEQKMILIIPSNEVVIDKIKDPAVTSAAAGIAAK